jgi:lactoylglutathione lyase
VPQICNRIAICRAPAVHHRCEPTPHSPVVLGDGTVILKPMNKARKLLHTRYRLNDLEKTVRFYKEVLGLEETRRHKSPRGSELVFLKAPESEELIELCHFPNSGPVEVQPDLTHLAFEVDSLEEFGRHLASLGLQYSDGPHLRENGSGFAFIDAPEGYEIELIQRAKQMMSSLGATNAET